MSSFIGRDAELEHLSETVSTCRLVTLVGPGGVGKTRLAVEVAASLRDEHRDGAWLVELAGVTEPEGVAPAVAGALGAAASAIGEPTSAGSRWISSGTTSPDGPLSSCSTIAST